MKRILSIIIILLFTLNAGAQWMSENNDFLTTSKITGVLTSENEVEKENLNTLRKILKHYSSATVSTAGILYSKYMDRKALKDAGLFSNAEENFYYKRIYTMVSSRLMPRIVSVSGKFLQYPENVLYWGPYLMRVTTDIEQLCMQFETLVANGRLSFKDIPFLIINEDLLDLFDLANLGDVEWKQMMDDFLDFGSEIFNPEDIVNDLQTLISEGTSIANAGSSMLSGMWQEGTSIGKKFSAKPKALLNMGKEFKNMYKKYENPQSIVDSLMSKIGSKDSIHKLFQVDNYNISKYISDYLHEVSGQYYRQRWYIYWEDRSTEQLCDYVPEDGYIDDYISGNEWYLTFPEFSDPTLTPQEEQEVKKIAEKNCGWSEEKVNELNKQGNGKRYVITYDLQDRDITQDYNERTGSRNPYVYAYSFAVKVYCYTNAGSVVYEDFFDSRTMNEDMFKAKLEGKLKELVAEDEIAGLSRAYKIGYDDKQYYSSANEMLLQGCAKVSYSSICHEYTDIWSGDHQWKVNPKHSPLNETSKQYAMATTQEDGGYNKAEFDAKEQEIQTEIDRLNRQINEIKNRNNQLYGLIKTTTDETLLAQYRREFNNNENKITTLSSQRDTAVAALSNLKQAKEEALQDYADDEDGVYRIPAIEKDVVLNFEAEWLEDGHWNGYLYERRCYLPSLQCEGVLSCRLSKVRGESYFLGIRTHRSILKLSYKLTVDYYNNEVIETMDLDPNATEEERLAAVNKRHQELMAQYPECTIEVNYSYTPAEKVEDNDDSIHLLWVSDRLAIAREIDSRLTNIYGKLVMLDRFMTQKLSLWQFLLNTAPRHIGARGKYGEITKECLERWRDCSVVNMVDSSKVSNKGDNQLGNKGNSDIEKEHFFNSQSGGIR